MTPATADEALVARTLAAALRGTLSVGPVDFMRLAAAAPRVPADRVAVLALIDWLRSDPRAQELIDVAQRLVQHDGWPNTSQDQAHARLADEIRRR
jgi:hypothetical protein